jgi:hypothetical protein
VLIPLVIRISREDVPRDAQVVPAN